MQLTQFTDYSLRALIFISLKTEACTIQEIADAYEISHHHLVKIIHHLGKLGLIKTLRGKNGGIWMNKNPNEIKLGDLIQQLESNFDLVPCFNQHKENCCIAPACKLKSILYEARVAFFNVLKKYTLADILSSNRKELEILLGITTHQ